MSLYGKFHPVIRKGLPDWKFDDVRWEEWYKEQKQYCMHGYEVGSERITGEYYFHLNFGTIQVGKAREFMNPFHVEIHKEFFDLIEYCEREDVGRDIICLKPRGVGISDDMVGSSLCQTQFFENARIAALFPKGNDEKPKKTFLGKYQKAYNRLPETMRHFPGLHKSVKGYEYGQIITDLESKKETIEGLQSAIHFMTAVDKDVLKSDRFKRIICDEIGEYDCLLDLVNENIENMRVGDEKFGTMLLAGTANNKNKGYRDVLEIWNNADAYGFEKFLILKHKTLFGFEPTETGKKKLKYIDEETGKPLEEKAMAWWKEEEEKNRKKGPDSLASFYQSNPTEEKHLFISAEESPFSQEYCAEQLAMLATNKKLEASIDIGNLERNEKGEVYFKATPFGRWRILIHPKPDDKLLNPDIVSIDSYMKSIATTSKSKGAILVYRDWQGVGKLGDLPICIYHHRPKDKDLFLDDCVLTAQYYKSFKQTHVEDVDEDVSKHFERTGNAKYLMPFPRIYLDLNSSAKAKWGTPATALNKRNALKRAVIRFDKNYQNIYFSELLGELQNFDIENTDIAMTYIWAVMASENNRQIAEKKEQAKENVKSNFMPQLLSINGEAIWIDSEEQLQNMSYHGR